MDPTSIVEDTERTRFCPQTDGQFVEAVGIIKMILLTHWPLGVVVVILKVKFANTLQMKFRYTFCAIAFRWMPQNTSADKSTLVQVMACCLMATSHYLNQYWPRSFLPYGVSMLQLVKCCLAQSSIVTGKSYQKCSWPAPNSSPKECRSTILPWIVWPETCSSFLGSCLCLVLLWTARWSWRNGHRSGYPANDHSRGCTRWRKLYAEND